MHIRQITFGSSTSTRRHLQERLSVFTNEQGLLLSILIFIRLPPQTGRTFSTVKNRTRPSYAIKVQVMYAISTAADNTEVDEALVTLSSISITAIHAFSMIATPCPCVALVLAVATGSCSLVHHAVLELIIHTYRAACTCNARCLAWYTLRVEG